MTKKITLAVYTALAVLAVGNLLAATPGKPKTVIHIITVQWKADA
jgi:hypothetical protein